MAVVLGACSIRLGQQSEGGPVVHVSDHVILNAVVKALERSSPFYSFRIVDGLYVATGFVVVPLADQVDDLTLLEAMGSPSVSKDGAEELAAHALIVAAEREFSVVVKDFNFDAIKVLRMENEKLRGNNRLLRSAWVQSLDHLETLQKTLEEITLDAVSGSPRNSIAVLAHGAAVWAEENVWDGTAAMENLSRDFMDED
ncbi:uncharacterized protein LOC120642869 [Panicum virgatum]|uniref:Uncharacterized protein n=1 Tax=Panicum virgatum TaxID=38727 RepID=A0A8T0QK31_PANVG|nr:uncharacterized protein LOC120642869 [Panicum virgatum]KAG2570614.1 hypothetical protein PVAP13_7KG097500 [Panicum virgatum]